MTAMIGSPRGEVGSTVRFWAHVSQVSRSHELGNIWMPIACHIIKTQSNPGSATRNSVCSGTANCCTKTTSSQTQCSNIHISQFGTSRYSCEGVDVLGGSNESEPSASFIPRPGRFPVLTGGEMSHPIIDLCHHIASAQTQSNEARMGPVDRPVLAERPGHRLVNSQEDFLD